MENRIRIKDIAAKAGVSKGTVDRVLHNRGNVSSTAKDKVLAAMKELHYQPNLIASALASKKSWRFAVLQPDDEQDPFWSQPKAGVIKAKQLVRDYRANIDFFHFRDADAPHFVELANQIVKAKYDGVLVSPSFSKEGHTVLQQFEEHHIPYVQFNTALNRESDYSLTYIGQNSYASGKLAAKLLDFGIGEGEGAWVLHLEQEVYNAQHLVDKENGFRDFFKQKNRQNINIHFSSFGDVFNKEGLTEHLKKTLKNYPKIRGIFVTTSKVFHIVPILEELGRTDIKLVGFDLIENNLNWLYKDRIHFLINQNPQKQGFIGIMTLFNALVLKKEIKPLQLLPLDVVMKENVQYYLEEDQEQLQVVL
ncbi:MAG: substrate-binding domain-containing protein [Saprospiraceae bacterium]